MKLDDDEEMRRHRLEVDRDGLDAVICVILLVVGVLLLLGGLGLMK